MKNKVIFDIYGLTKVLKSISFLAILLTVLCTDASQQRKRSQYPVRGRGRQQSISPRPQPRNNQPQPQRRAQGQPPVPVIVTPTPSAPAQNPNLTLADEVAWILQQDVPWSPEANTTLARIWPQISPEQQKSIDNYYKKQIEFKKMQQQVESLKQKIKVQPVGSIEKAPRKEANKGWLYSVTGYDSSQLTPEQGMALGAASVLGTGLAAITAPVWLPALGAAAVYVGPVGIAKLGAAAYGVNSINFALKNKSITMQGAIDSRKYILQLQLTGGMYPTLALQQEVLVGNGRLELLTVGEDLESKIFTQACENMLAELKKLDEKLTEEQRNFANDINNAVETCRKKHDKESSKPITYLNNIKQDISSKNIAEVLAYASEYQRTENQLNLGITARLEQKRAEAAAAAEKAQKEVETARTGQSPAASSTPSANEGALRKAWNSWWTPQSPK